MRVFLPVLAAFVFFSCTTPQNTITTVQRVPAKFDYSPQSRSMAGVTNLTIALVRPRFIGQNPEYYIAPFNEMASSMANDFEELLTSKGFKIRGPFGSRDEMVYNDKTGSDFVFDVAIDLTPLYNRKFVQRTSLGAMLTSSTGAQYSTVGEITLSGSLVITASSPQYGEKIWKKNIALDRASFVYTGKLKWSGQPTMADEIRQDNVVYNTLSRELEKFYQQAMNLAWQQIDPAEMKSVAEQSKKADKKG